MFGKVKDPEFIPFSDYIEAQRTTSQKLIELTEENDRLRAEIINKNSDIVFLTERLNASYAETDRLKIRLARLLSR